jgi:hypothetical protein
MMILKFRFNKKWAPLSILGGIAILGCTQSANQFRLQPTTESVESGFDVGEEVVERESVPVDILWVIDNSASMASSQAKLKAGLAKFARKFFKSGTDIQIGVITTDAYLKDKMWEKFLLTPLAKSKKLPKDLFPNLSAELKSNQLLRTSSGNLESLIKSFEDGVSVGITGAPEERGFDSVRVFLELNEKSATAAHKLFRKNAKRIIVFLTDEDEQTVDPAEKGPEPYTVMVSGGEALPSQITTKCEPTVVEGVTLAPVTVCTKPELLLGVSAFKESLDSFFGKLDGGAGAAPGKFLIVSIVSKNLKTIQDLRVKAGDLEIAHTRGDRYVELATLAGDGSFSMDIGAEDYSEILEKIGLEVVKHSTTTKFVPVTRFKLDRIPAEGERFLVILLSTDGSSVELQETQYVLRKNTLTITDPALIAGLKKGDEIRVRYQPSTVHPAN